MTALVPTNVQLPAHLASRLGAQSNIAGSMTAGIGGASFKKISLRGSRFRIKEGATETVLPSTTLRAVIVGASTNLTKVFYKGVFDPKAEDKTPDCYSTDGVRPANDAADPQAQQCATCEQNQWGSKLSESGSKMKACADQKRLAIISADDNSSEPEVYLLQVPPASLMNFRNYGKQLESKGFPPELCITELSFDTEQSYPKLEFKFGGFVEEHMVPTIDELVGSDQVREITGEAVQVATIIEPPARTKPAPARVKVPEPVEEVEVEIIPAPTKAKGFGAATPAKATIVATPPKAPPVVQSSKLTDEIQNIINSMQDEENE